LDSLKIGLDLLQVSLNNNVVVEGDLGGGKWGEELLLSGQIKGCLGNMTLHSISVACCGSFSSSCGGDCISCGSLGG
jgi:hypothetical protein